MIRYRAVGAALLLCLSAVPAFAAKCYIREYNTIGQAQNQPAQIAFEPSVADQVTGDFSGGAVQSSAFNVATTFIRLWCDTQGSFLVGTNPTAAATNAPVAAGVPEYFGVPPGGSYKLSVHANP
jgi:hypothetical protein